MAAATRRKKKLDFPTAQFLIAITVGFCLFLLFGITHRVALNYRVNQRKMALEQRYTLLVQENAQLINKYREVHSNADVVAAARRELRWSRAGETMVVIVAPPHARSISIASPEISSLPAEVPPGSSATTATEPLDRWIELFFPAKP